MPDSLTCSQPVSSSQNYTPASQEPNGICGAPRAAVVHDEQLDMCYSVTVPCGSNQNLETERFRDQLRNENQAQRARSLANSVAARLHQNESQRLNQASAQARPAPEEHGALWHAIEFLVGLTPLGWSGCAPVQPDEPDTHPEIPDGSNPPPGFDPVCDGRRGTIQSSDPLASFRTPQAVGDGGTADGGMSTTGVLAELNRQYPGITLPTLNVAYNGTTPIYNDSLGRPVTTITTSNPVSFSRIGNNLFVLTANSVSGGYAPATLLVYDVSSNPPRPVPTDDIARDSRGGASNAIVLGFYNPAAMAPMVGNAELDILFGAPNAGIVTTIDPFTMRIVESDWCSTHNSQQDGGTDGSSDAATGIDGGVVDGSRDSGTDSRDASVDAASDTRDAASDSDAGSDARDGGTDGSRG